MQSKLNDLLDGFHFSIVLCGENKDSVKTKIMEDHFSNIFEFVKNMSLRVAMDVMYLSQEQGEPNQFQFRT